jgi:glutathione reductase (NADPH)
MSYDYDLLVIGAGSAGLAAAKRAASYGVNVGIIEEKQIGGTCVNQGCVAEKLLSYAASFPYFFKHAQAYGWQGALVGSFDWNAFIKAKDAELERLNQVHLKKLSEAGVAYIMGQASFLNETTVSVNNNSNITARKFLIATGSQPIKPEVIGINYAITSREMFDLMVQPKQLAIIGGNYIAVKAAQTLNALGTKVTQIFLEDTILTRFDTDIAQRVQASIVKRGVQVICNTKVKSIELQADCLKMSLDGVAQNTLLTSTVLNVTKRSPNTAKLNPEKVGLKLQKQSFEIDAQYRTNLPNVFAIGDCLGCGYDLTPIASAEGQAFADIYFGGKSIKLAPQFIPIGLSSQPEAASIGWTEKEARLKLSDRVKTYCKEFKPLFHSLTGCEEKTFIKLVVNSKTDKVLGLHMIGESAYEIVQSFGLALKLGATKKDFDCAIGIHPSQAEEFFSI